MNNFGLDYRARPRPRALKPILTSLPATLPATLPAALAATLFTALAAFGAQAAEPPAAPGAGNLLQQLKPAAPASPSATTTGLTVRREDGATLPPGEALEVNALHITGNTRFDATVLHGLVADAEGKRLNLAQLSQVADRITEYYHSHHYPLARAILPAQTIKGGVVVIQVLEARYGKVGIGNQSSVRDPLLRATLAPLRSGDVIEQRQMDHVLLLLSDVPNITVNAVLKPGEAVGTSDLAISALPGPRVTAIASLDDYGNRYTGRTRGAATVSLIEPLGLGDYLSLAGLSSGEGLNYGRLSYEATVSGSGTRVGAAFSGLHYKLGDGLTDLKGHGTAEVASVWAKQPLVRSQHLNVYAQVQYDRLKLDDSLDASAIKTDRHLDSWTGSLTGDARDTLASGGVSTGTASATGGRVDFDNDAAQISDAVAAKTVGRFVKWNLNLARLQRLSESNGLYVSLSGQWTRNNLDSAEKMIAGGPYGVRAYDLGILSGDTGELGSAEFQHDLGPLGGGRWQAVAFVDSEHIRVDQRPWITGPNSATLSGAGLGLSWAGPHRWRARTYVAARFGAVPVLAPDSSSVRVWAELSREF